MRFTISLWREFSNAYLNKWRFRLFRIIKRIILLTKIKSPDNQLILFIIGCQRSGTTLLTDIFENNINVRVFREFSELSSSDPKRVRLNPLSSVKIVFNKQKASLIVSKPLVETQNALSLLEYFQNSSVLWVYRNYKDVAYSDIRNFGSENGIRNLQPIVEGDQQDWRSEKISEHTRNIAKKHFSQNMDPYSAAALFWLVRNSIFFDFHLNNNRRVMMCKYEDLVRDPAKIISGVYQWIGLKYPGDQCHRNVHCNSIGKGASISIHEEIDLLCSNLLYDLDRSYYSQYDEK